jgi:hypothetical protein
LPCPSLSQGNDITEQNTYDRGHATAADSLTN